MSTNSIASIATSLPPIELVSWLNAEGSLTAMLEEKAGQPLRVERTFEGYRLLTLQQKRQLGLQGSALNRPLLAWIREVLLYGNDEQPWVGAQSIFPLSSLKGKARRLQQLKVHPSVMCYLNVGAQCQTSDLCDRRARAGNGKRAMTGMVAYYLSAKPFCRHFCPVILKNVLFLYTQRKD